MHRGTGRGKIEREGEKKSEIPVGRRAALVRRDERRRRRRRRRAPRKVCRGGAVRARSDGYAVIIRSFTMAAIEGRTPLVSSFVYWCRVTRRGGGPAKSRRLGARNRSAPVPVASRLVSSCSPRLVSLLRLFSCLTCIPETLAVHDRTNLVTADRYPGTRTADVAPGLRR